MKRSLLVLLLAGCGGAIAPAPPALPMSELGEFEHKERMKLPEAATRWNGKLVRATGYINPPMGNTRDLAKFLLVKDLGSCCFGKFPQINHYVEVKLKPGQKLDYTRDPVTVQGEIVVEERFDGDWPLGLYWMEGAEVVR